MYILIGIASFLALFVGVPYVVQPGLVYYPSPNIHHTPADLGLEYEDVWFTADHNVRLHAWFVPSPESRGTVVFFHGNAGNISDRLQTIFLIHRMNLDLLMVDYRGYGRSQGSPREQGTYDDAMAAWKHLTGERGVDPGKIIVWGRSLGGGVASWLATREGVDPGLVILESTFTSLTAVGERVMPKVVPVRLLSRFSYKNIERVPHLPCPVLFVHSRHDELIPFDQAQANFDAASEPKALLSIGGGHSNGFLLSGTAYFDGVTGFVTRHLGGDPGTYPTEEEVPDFAPPGS